MSNIILFGILAGNVIGICAFAMIGLKDDRIGRDARIGRGEVLVSVIGGLSVGVIASAVTILHNHKKI